MIIYNPNGTPIIDLEVDDTSFCLQSIMDSDDVQLEFSLTEHVELPIGAYVEFQGNRYELLKDENVTINHSRDLSYKVLLSGPIGRAKNYIIHNPIDHRLKFDLIAKPADHLAMIVANLNERDGAGVWAVGTCIEKNEVSIPYNHTYCIDGLKQLADQCKTEFEITRRTDTTFAINLRKVEYYKDSPLALGYGHENGFLPGISREESSEALEKVWIEGGDKNISLKEYGASILHLPKNLIFSFDGEKFEGESGYDREKGVSMVTDADGYSVKLATAAVNATEGSLDVTSIYPSRTGLVKGLRFEYKKWYYTYEELIAAFPSLTDEDWDAVQVDIVDSTIPADLDYSACLLPNGSPLLLTFQSGPLAGREFDVTFCKAAKTDTRVTEQGTQSVTRPANKFELKKADHDGISMPTRNFLPTAENEYIITNCYLPQAYISDPATFSGVEYDALREAATYLYENKDKKRSYRGEIDSLFAKRNWLNVSSHLRLGAYISFSHPDVQPTPIAVRITSLKQFINKPEKPQIEISNGIISLGKSTQIDELKNKEAHVEAATSSAVRVAKRGFSDAKETAQMLIDAALEGFDPEITPVAIQTMQLIAGDESLQFKFWTSRACTTPVAAPVSFNPTDKRVHYEACCLQHMTLGISDMAPSHELSEYKIWNMSAGESAVLVDPEKKYYAYAKVDAANDGQSHLSGQFILSETAIPMRSVSGYYHLLVGILASEKEGDRSFANMFGFTEITPGQVLTEVIRNSTGESFFDTVRNAARLGLGPNDPYIEWNKGGSKALKIHGAISVDGGGSESPLIVSKGEYSSSGSYYWGDVVTYQGSSYLCIYEFGAVKNKVPTDTTYWKLWISKGDSAEPLKVQYSTNGSSWHDAYQDGDEYMRIYSQGSWGSAVKIKGEQGKIGPDGRKAPYHDFMFGISAYTSASGAPSDISSWHDTPPATTSAKPYLWCRDRYYTVDSSNQWVLNSTTYYRVTGERGARGENGNITKHQWALTLTTNPPAESQWKNSFSDVADHHGYYLWQRLLESTDGGATWTVNADSVGITLDPTITRAEAEAQEALTEIARQTTAQKLGYASWESFSASVAASSVLIQGGQLNAALINTELLIAKMVKTAMSGLRVEVADNEISIFDNSETLVARMHGNYNSSIYDFVSVSGSQTSVDVAKNRYDAKGTSEYSGSGYLSDLYCEFSNSEGGRAGEYTGNSFQITNVGVSRVTGRLQIYLRTAFESIYGIPAYSMSGAFVGAYVYLSTSPSYNSYTYNLGSVNAYQSNYHVDTSKYLDFNITLGQGTYYVWIQYYGDATLLVQSSWSYINYNVIFSCAASVLQTAAAKVSLISEKLEIFANGAGYRHTQNDYAVLLRTGASKSSSGYLQGEVQSGLAGLRIGQNYSGSYLEARMGSSYFGIVPKVIAKFLWNSSNSTYNLTRWMVRGSTSGTKPYTAQEDRGVVFNLPNDTSETFGDGDIYIATCQVTANSQQIAAEVQRMTTTQIRIYTANSNRNWERCHISLLVW